jgi:flagellin-like protein
MINIRDRNGVSPIISALLMITITLILAGVIVFIISQYFSNDRDTGEMWFFGSDADASSDTVEIQLTKGSINSTRIDVRLDGVLLNHTSEMIGPGDVYSIPAMIDIVQGQTYRIIIIVDDKVMYNNEIVAKP